MCFQNETCHHENGSCLNGCDLGYNEPLCKMGKPHSKLSYYTNSFVYSCVLIIQIVTLRFNVPLQFWLHKNAEMCKGHDIKY